MLTRHWQATWPNVTPATTNPPNQMAGDKSVNWWGNTSKYVVSLLKAWWPDVDPAVSYKYLPKKKASGVNYTHMGMIQAIGEVKVEGLWIWGQNPAAGGPTSLGARDALKKLKWMVASDIWYNETHLFWKRPGVNPADIQTEVFLLPAAGSFEKEGSISNSGRWVQWRYKAVEPPGEAIPDLEMMIRLFKRIRKLYEEVKEGKPALFPSRS